jgi:protein-tyrosine phosphatase
MEEERSPFKLHDVGFVDVHCHILPGLDDGPSDWEESLRMAQLAVAEGVTTLVATPHQLGAYSQNSVELIRERGEEFRRRLASEGIELQVQLGADIRLEPELPEKVAEGEVLCLGEPARFVLVELPSEVTCPVGSLLKKLGRLGVTPILTHPERSLLLARNQEFLRQWVADGGLIQVTGASLTGSFGLVVQSVAERLLREGLVHLVASDAHGATCRRPLWRRVYQRLAELGGPDWARLLCQENPARVVTGQDVLEVPPISIGILPKFWGWLSRKVG